MAERSKALRSGRSPVLWAWVQIPLLTLIWLCNLQLLLLHLLQGFLKYYNKNIRVMLLLNYVPFKSSQSVFN